MDVQYQKVLYNLRLHISELEEFVKHSLRVLPTSRVVSVSALI